MAPKRSAPSDDSPSASSDYEDDETTPPVSKSFQNPNSETEESSSGEDSESESEPKPKPTPVSNPKSQIPSSKAAQSSSSGEEYESESEPETTPLKTPVPNPQTQIPNSKTAQSSSSGEESESECEPKTTPVSNPKTQIPNSKTTQSSSSGEESESEPKTTPVSNPQTQTPNPKSAQSSSEEEESDSESEAEAEEKPAATPLKTSVSTPKSSSGSESEPEPDSPTASAFTIKPSKRLDALQTPEKKPNSKHTNEVMKFKVSNGEDVVDVKKSTVKRLWTEDDELVLLQCLIDYKSAKGCSPLSDLDGFNAFISGSLAGNMSNNQLYTKVNRLKKRYLGNMGKKGSNGEDPVFSKPHEYKLFELSKKVWGCDNGEVKVKVNTKENQSQLEPKEEVKEGQEMWVKGEGFDFEAMYPHWTEGLRLQDSSALTFPKNGVELVKRHFRFIGGEQAREMEELWKAYYEEEIVLRAKKHKLLGELYDVVTK